PDRDLLARPGGGSDVLRAPARAGPELARAPRPPHDLRAGLAGGGGPTDAGGVRLAPGLALRPQRGGLRVVLGARPPFRTREPVPGARPWRDPAAHVLGGVHGAERGRGGVGRGRPLRAGSPREPGGAGRGPAGRAPGGVLQLAHAAGGGSDPGAAALAAVAE